jgi:hypothetical protein
MRILQHLYNVNLLFIRCYPSVLPSLINHDTFIKVNKVNKVERLLMLKADMLSHGGQFPKFFHSQNDNSIHKVISTQTTF